MLPATEYVFRVDATRSPLLRHFEPAAAVELAVGSPGLLPIGRGGVEVPENPQTLPVLVEPLTESGPLADERFVGDLDSWLSGLRVTIDRDQSVVDEGAKD